jgi:hypothetical protein
MSIETLGEALSSGGASAIRYSSSRHVANVMLTARWEVITQ